MVVITKGLRPDGTPCTFYMDSTLANNFDAVIKRVKRGWDYCACTSGLPGVGKSNFSFNCARYCCEWFDKSYVTFTAQEFIKVTSECSEYSSVVLDESFATLNTRISNSKDFLQICNHLSILRQKHLFIFLNIPNFFDLNKSIALWRCSHLFVVYANEEGYRGRFIAFDRPSKRELYVDGSKYIDYECVDGNFTGRFIKQK